MGSINIINNFECSSYKEKLKGKTVKDVLQNGNADEGLVLVFTDESVFEFGFSACEGGFSFVEKT